MKSNNIVNLLRKVNLKKIITVYNLLFIFIIFVSLGLRLYKIIDFPQGIEGDDMTWTITAFFHQKDLSAIKAGVWSQIDELAEIYPISIEIIQLSFFLFGVNFYSPHIILALISFFSLFLFYFLSRVLFENKITSLLLLILYSFSSFKLTTSRISIPHCYYDLFFIGFLLTAVLLGRKMLNKKKIKANHAILLSFILGLLAFLNLKVYNLFFIFPFLILVYLFCVFVFNKINKSVTLKTKISKISLPLSILIIIAYLLPLLLNSKFILNSFHREYGSKAYAFDSSVLDLESLEINFHALQNNVQTVKSQLFDQLKYNTSDMLFESQTTIFNKYIALLSLIGLSFAILHFKDNLFVLCLVPNIVAYQIMFGLNLPRMWVLNFVIYFLLAGVAIDKILKYIDEILELNPDKNIKYILGALLIILFGSYIKASWNDFSEVAMNNPAYKKEYLNIINFAQNNYQYLQQNNLFIAEPIKNDLWWSTAYFYLLNNKGQKLELNKADYLFFNQKDISQLQQIDQSINYLLISPEIPLGQDYELVRQTQVYDIYRVDQEIIFEDSSTTDIDN